MGLLQENGDNLDNSHKGPHSSITVNIAYTELTPQSVPILDEGHEDSEMDFDLYASLSWLKGLTISETGWIDPFADSLFDIPGLNSERSSDDSTLSSSRSWFNLPEPDKFAWHSSELVDELLEDVTTKPESFFQAVDQILPSKALSRIDDGWPQQLSPTEPAPDKVNTSPVQSPSPNQMPRRRRRQIKPIIGPGPNKYGRSGKPRCEVCRSRKQKVCDPFNEIDCSASIHLSSCLAHFALIEALRAIRFGGQSDNKIQTNKSSYFILEWKVCVHYSENRNSQMMSVLRRRNG